MYSYEQRMRAVKLYIELGKRSAATRRKLGYPARNSLVSWYREFLARDDLQAHYTRTWQKYSEEQKKAAVDHFASHDHCYSATLKALGYPSRGALTAWVHERYPGFRKYAVGKASRTPHSLTTKRTAVYELCTRQDSAQAVADKLDVDRVTLYHWKNQLLGREAPASMKRPKDQQVQQDQAELERQIESLRRELRTLQLEHDLLKKANEILKKDLGVNLLNLPNREKTKLVDALRGTYALTELLERLALARSSFFYHQGRIKLGDEHAEARHTITSIFERNHRCYGYRRVRASLGRLRVFISEKVVRRLMKQECLVVPRPRRRRYKSYLGEIGPAPENLVNRDFQASAPNEKWLTDISEFQIPAGKVYLSPMIDCFDGMVISWAIGTSPDAQLANTMLDAAIETVADCDGRPVVHSDRGAHYRWPGWISRIGNAKLVRSMSRKACSPDNAACEGFFGRLKTELFYPRDWKTTTIDEFIRTLDEYIRWYNESRIKSCLGYRSPIEFCESLGLTT